MYKAAVSRNRIKVDNPDGEIMTSGSVNVNFIEFTFSEDWVGLKKTVLFQTKKALLPIILEPEVVDEVESLVYTMPIPWEVLVYANESINVGAYGTQFDDEETVGDEAIVLPTVWGTIPDKVKQGVIVSDPIEPSPTHNAYLYLLQLIEELIEGGGGGAGTFDHTLLKNRDAADQHPIDSITELREFIVDTNSTFDDISLDFQNVDKQIQTLMRAIEDIPVPITDHNALTGRDTIDAHPIASITGLEDRLERIEDSTSGGSEDIYSTEEKRVGIWIDGKPIYRRVFNTKTSSKINDHEPIITFDFPIFLISLRGVMDITNLASGSYIEVPFSDGLGAAVKLYLNNDRIIICNVGGLTDYTNRDVFVIVEYIKLDENGEGRDADIS